MPTNVPYLKYAQSRSLGDVLSLPESERAKRLNYWEKLGLISPQKDGILTETLEGLADSSLSVAQGFGATLAEAGLGSGVEDYFNSVRARHRDIEPYEGYKAASWDPVSWGRTFGNALGTTIPSGVAGMAATAATGNPGIGGYVSVATMASHMWGDKVREYREAMPELGEGAVKGLALFETLGEAFIENYGPLDVAKAARNAIAGSVKKASQEAIEGTVRKFGRKAVWDFLKKAGEGGIGEGGEEIAQTYWDMLCRRIGGDTKTPMPDWEQIKEEFMGGFIGGVGLGGGEAALEAGLDASRRYREVEPRDNKIKLPEPNKNGIKLPVPQEYDEDRQRHLSDDFIQYMAGHIGVKVREATAEEVRAKEQEATAKRGKELDGLVIPGWRERGSDTVVLNTKAGTEGMARAFGHEVKHWMDENHPELTKKFDTLLDTLMNSRGKAALQEAAERWGDAGNAREEFFCDVFGELVENPNAMDSLCKKLEAKEEGLGRKFAEAVKEFIQMMVDLLRDKPQYREQFEHYRQIEEQYAQVLADVAEINHYGRDEKTGAPLSAEHSVPVNTSEVKLDPGFFQHRRNADGKTGVVPNHKITGKYQSDASGKFLVWEDNGGQKWLVNGHHRWQMVQEQNVPSVDAIVVKESDGVTKEQAKQRGIKMNLYEGTASPEDAAEYFRANKMTPEEARNESLLKEGPKYKDSWNGYWIGTFAGDNLYENFRDGSISASKAAVISEVAQGNNALEDAGLKLAKNNPPAQLKSALQLLKKSLEQQGTKRGGEQLLFDGLFDDSAIKLAEQQSKVAGQHIGLLRTKVKRAEDAIRLGKTNRNFDSLKELGIEIRDYDDLKRKLDTWQRELHDWEHYETNGELIDQINRELGEAEKPQAKPEKKAKPEKPKKKSKPEAKPEPEKKDEPKPEKKETNVKWPETPKGYRTYKVETGSVVPGVSSYPHTVEFITNDKAGNEVRRIEVAVDPKTGEEISRKTTFDKIAEQEEQEQEQKQEQKQEEQTQSGELTEEQIRNSGAKPSTIHSALDYLKGNHSISNTIAYKAIRQKLKGSEQANNPSKPEPKPDKQSSSSSHRPTDLGGKMSALADKLARFSGKGKTQFSIAVTPEAEQALKHSRHALQDIATGHKYGVLHNAKYGEIHYPLGKMGKNGYGFLHIIERRMQHDGNTLQEAIDVALKVGMAVELGNETLERYNTRHLDYEGVRAIIAIMANGNKIITGYEIKADDKTAANRRAESLQSQPHVSSEEIVAALKDTLAQKEEISNSKPENPNPVSDIPGETQFSLREEEPPKRTLKGYKLMRMDGQGNLYALFIDRANQMQLGQWYDAESPKADDLRTLREGMYLVDRNGKATPFTRARRPSVKEVDEATANGGRYMEIGRYADGSKRVSNIGVNGSGTVASFAYRPGWHATNAPSAPHIGGGQRRANEVWVEIEYAADNDFQQEALSKASPMRNGRPNTKEAQLDHIPTNGYYHYRTNSNADERQDWILTGSIKPVRILSDSEVEKINRKGGFKADAPRKERRIDSGTQFSFVPENNKNADIDFESLDEEKALLYNEIVEDTLDLGYTLIRENAYANRLEWRDAMIDLLGEMFAGNGFSNRNIKQLFDELWEKPYTTNTGREATLEQFAWGQHLGAQYVGFHTEDFEESINVRLEEIILGDDKQKGKLVHNLASEVKVGQKEMEDRVEILVGKMANRINQDKNRTEEQKFTAVQDLYKAQPNLATRTATSMELQQYSTPIPLAYVLQKWLGMDKGGKTTYEPTAGTGTLVCLADKSHTDVNELGKTRAILLHDGGYRTITQKDATQYVPEGKYDYIIMNPPFGSAKEEIIDGMSVSNLGPIIAMKALHALKDDGKAAIIVGANTSGFKGEGQATRSDTHFREFLYNNYNVAGDYIMDGELYSRQGTKYPVRILLLDGRKAVPTAQYAPKNTMGTLSTWDEVYNRILEEERETLLPPEPETNPEPEPTPEPENNPEEEEFGKEKEKAEPEEQDEFKNLKDIPEEERVPVGERISNLEAHYVPASKGKSLGVCVPAEQAAPLARALTRLNHAHNGDIDGFVAEELGYDSKDELFEHLSAEQIDAVAQIIHNFKMPGSNNSMIIADQTGIGKGRVCASVMRWAKRNGYLPVFFTYSADLFSDMFRDMEDIGETDVRPLLVSDSAKATIKKDGKAIYKALSTKAQLKALSGLALSGLSSGGANDFDSVFLNYAQINDPEGKSKNRVEALQELFKNRKCLLVMDEAHMGAGQSNTGAFFYGESVKEGEPPIGVLHNPKLPVLYTSATFAKTSENLPVFFRARMGNMLSETGIANLNQLSAVLNTAGDAGLQLLSNSLVESGNMRRLERSYDGVSYTTVNPSPERQTQAIQDWDKIAKVLRKLCSFSEILKEVIKKHNEWESKKRPGERERISTGGFGSRLYSVVRYALFNLKLKSSIDEAVKDLQAGKKVVIAVDQTGESTLKRLSETHSPDEDFRKFGAKEVLNLTLDRMLEGTQRLPGTTKEVTINLADHLGTAGQLALAQVKGIIDDIDVKDFTLSPIDYVKKQLSDQGYRVGEVTGREKGIDYETGELVARPKVDNKVEVAKFNSGEYDVIILNSSGSTGISLHASEKFKDQKPRVMHILQAAQDITTFMQTIGRIFRTGQVHLPEYKMLNSGLAAEIRHSMRLAEKMKSLNATTTGTQEGNMEVGDNMYNKYGDKVALDVLMSMPPNIEGVLAAPLKNVADEKGNPAPGLAASLVRNASLLSNADQKFFLDQLIAQYAEFMEKLTQNGMNDLIIQDHTDWTAEETGRTIITKGDDKSTSSLEHSATLSNIHTQEVTQTIQPETAVNARKKNAPLEKHDAIQRKLSDDLERLEGQSRFKAEDPRLPRVLEKGRTNLQAIREIVENCFGGGAVLLTFDELGEESRYMYAYDIQFPESIFDDDIDVDYVSNRLNLGNYRIKFVDKYNHGETLTLAQIHNSFSEMKSKNGVTVTPLIEPLEYYFPGTKEIQENDHQMLTGNIFVGLNTTLQATGNGGVLTGMDAGKSDKKGGWGKKGPAGNLKSSKHIGNLISFRDRDGQKVYGFDLTNSAAEATLNSIGKTRAMEQRRIRTIEEALDDIRNYKYIVNPVVELCRNNIAINIDAKELWEDAALRQFLRGDLTKSSKIMVANVKDAEGLLRYLWKKGQTFYRNGTQFSFMQKQQVNPIREAGPVQDWYNDMLGALNHVKKRKTLQTQAIHRIANFGGMREALSAVITGDYRLESDVAMMAGQILLNSEEFKELPLEKRAIMANAYMDAGTQAGRTLQARRLGKLDITDIDSIQAAITAWTTHLMAKYPKIDHIKRMMEATGVDPTAIPAEYAEDPEMLDKLLRDYTSATAHWGDKAYEWWVNSILSAPTTHVANTLGNVGNMLYELGAKRFAEAAINIFAKNPRGATFGELKHMWSAFNWKQAWAAAKVMMEREVLDEGSKFDLDNLRGPAIEGTKGRLVRTPGRFLRGADQFIKCLVRPIEASAMAYREAKNNNLSEAETVDYIQHQLEDETSTANEWGRKRALELTFNDNPGEAVNWLVHMRNKVPGMRYLFPFVRTPANILRQGIRKGPLGIVNLAAESAQVLLGNRKADEEYLGHIAEQVVFWGGMMMLMTAHGGDDSDEPWITGNNLKFGAEGRFKNVHLPPLSIRIGGKWYSYRRIEPLATGLASFADGLNAYREAKSGEKLTNALRAMITGAGKVITEKSYLDSIEQLVHLLEDPDRYAEDWAANFLASWSPNAYRQVVNALHDNAPDYKAGSRNWILNTFQQTLSRAGFYRQTPKLDYFGRPVPKDLPQDETGAGSIAYRLLVPIPRRDAKGMDDVERLMWNYNKGGETPYWPSLPSPYFSVNGVRYEVANYEAYATRAGQLAHQRMLQAVKQGRLNVKSPGKYDIDLIKKMFTEARKQAKLEFLQRRQVIKR